MRPIRLEFQAFGPYIEKQVVEFEKLYQSGIFLIKGKTGSGKTTIYDALTFALYGGGSGQGEKGSNGRNSIEEWRCTKAPDDLGTYVLFEFSVNGNRYCFERGYRKRQKVFSTYLNCGYYDEQDNLIPFFQHPKEKEVNAKAADLIGLTKDQFRQVMLLPQGQFERFLTASSDEKEKILQKIFQTEKWEQYANSFYKQASDREHVLKELKTSIDNSLMEEGFTTIVDLEDRIQELKKEKGERDQKHQAYNGEQLRKELKEDLALANEFSSFHELENEQTKQIEKKHYMDTLREKVLWAEKAEDLRDLLSAVDDKEKEKNRRLKMMNSAEQAVPTAQNKLDKAGKKKESHDFNSPIDQLNLEIGNLEGKRGFYENIGDLQTAFSKACDELKVSTDLFKKAEDDKKRALTEAGNLKEVFNQKDDLARMNRNAYYSGIYGEIAQDLVEGEKCPICGSLHHPEPAEKNPGSVSKEVMENSEKEAKQARNKWDQAEKKRQDAETDWNKKQAEKYEKESAKQNAENALNTAKQSMIPGIHTLQELNDQIQAKTKAIDDYRTESEKIGKEYQSALGEVNAAETTLSNAKSEYESAMEDLGAAQTNLESSILKNGFSDVQQLRNSLLSSQERNQINKEITEYNTRCKDVADQLNEKKKKLDGKNEPDAALFDQREKAIQSEQDQYAAFSAQNASETKRLEKKYRDLSAKVQYYDGEIHQADADFSFAKVLRGDTGMGISRYVLAVMFGQVISEANQMLKLVHGGRYSLFRTDEKGSGNKKGLELKVHDTESPEKEGRSVDLLSGGEKFLVSMALSIGMSTVAQKSGIRIEALFIDEGFGTLDESSINDSMAVLDVVRNTSGLIGIISHVKVLDDNIPTKIEVVKGKAGIGSKLKVC